MKGKEDLNNTVNHLHLIDVYRTLHLAECMFFSSAHGIFTKGDYMQGHKTSLHKNKVIGPHKVYSTSTTELN